MYSAKIASFAAKFAARRLPVKLIGSSVAISKVVETKWEGLKSKLSQQQVRESYGKECQLA